MTGEVVPLTNPESAEPTTGVVTVRLWAGAKAAAGSGEVLVPVSGPVTVAWLREEVLRLASASASGGTSGGRLRDVLAVCSVLVGEQPVTSGDPTKVVVRAGETVDFLPPFAGG